VLTKQPLRGGTTKVGEGEGGRGGRLSHTLLLQHRLQVNLAAAAAEMLLEAPAQVAWKRLLQELHTMTAAEEEAAAAEEPLAEKLLAGEDAAKREGEAAVARPGELCQAKPPLPLPLPLPLPKRLPKPEAGPSRGACCAAEEAAAGAAVRAPLQAAQLLSAESARCWKRGG
jgi:hypothetical protein